MKKITQDELIPYIIKVLYEYGGRATKSQVENKIYELLKSIFQHKWYHATVSHGVPRWKHDIAWAKERARQRHGFVKSSERGIWELTQGGKRYYSTPAYIDDIRKIQQRIYGRDFDATW